MKLKDLLIERITWKDLRQVEKFADDLWHHLGIDVQFTKHFMDRVNHPRNREPITVDELIRLFKKEYELHGKEIKGLGHEHDGIMKDLFTKLNLPFVITSNDKMVAKTIMRKQDFKSHEPEFTVEGQQKFNFLPGVVAVIDDGDFDRAVEDKEFEKIWAFRRKKDADEFSKYIEEHYPDEFSPEGKLAFYQEKCRYSTLGDQYIIAAVKIGNARIHNLIFFAVGKSPADIEDEWHDELMDEGPPGDLSFIKLHDTP